ncbi:MAG: hypothetical protein KDI13_10610 [Alphaproteobacteria bacterium]|nr:hypothetical protein [Alphaproteobacteria bacterium]
MRIKSKIFKLVCFTTFLLFCHIACVASSYAQSEQDADQVKTPGITKVNKNDIFARFKKPMPKVPPMDDKEFEDLTNLYETVPFNDPLLAYSIRVPKDWEKMEDKGSSNFLLSNKLFSDMGLFYSPPDLYGRSKIEIKVINLEYQMTAEQWYLMYILQTGMTTEGMTVYDDNKAEALTVIMEQDVSFIKRTVVQINGKRLILVDYFVPLANWKKDQSVQSKVIESFKIKNPKHEYPEEFLKYQFLDIAEVQYPESWDVRPAPLRSADRMASKFIKLHKTTDPMTRKVKTSTEGQIEVSLISLMAVETVSREIDLYKKNLENSGMIIGEKLENIDSIKYSKSFTLALTEVYRAIDSTHDDIDYELWYSVLIAGNYVYMVTLLTPGRNDSFALWVRNTEAYKTIIQNTRTSANGFDLDGSSL